MHRKPDNRLKSVAHYTSRTLYISLLGGFLLCHRRDHPFIHGCHRDPYTRQTRHHRGVLFYNRRKLRTAYSWLFGGIAENFLSAVCKSLRVDHAESAMAQCVARKISFRNTIGIVLAL